MLIGVPREIKESEGRVALHPAGAQELVSRGHVVLVEKGAGVRSSISDDDFENAGSKICDRSTVFAEAETILKVKEPLPEETALLHEGQILFTFLHLAANKKLTEQLLSSRVLGIAYETIELADGSLPILMPMTEVVTAAIVVKPGESL